MSMIEPTDAQIDAAFAVLSAEVMMPYAADVSDYISSPSDPPAGLKRDEALAALRAADEQAEEQNRAVVRRALTAALNADAS